MLVRIAFKAASKILKIFENKTHAFAHFYAFFVAFIVAYLLRNER